MSKPFLTTAVLLNSVSLLSGAADPTAGAGVPAAIGSKYYRSGTSGDYTKTGAADTAWGQTTTGIYFNVKDYGAAGDNVTDDRASIQEAIDDAVAAGGGTVFFPPGTYLCGKDGANPWSFRINGVDNVRFLGCGWSGSVLKQSGNAGAGAFHLVQIEGGSDSTEFQSIVLDQGGLVNPGADLCSLIEVTEATIVKFVNCRFTGGVANAGAYVHVGGVLGDEVDIVMLDACDLRDAGGPCVWIESGVRHAWVTDSFIVNSNAEPDTILLEDSTGDEIQDLKIMGCYVENATHYGIRGTAVGGQILRMQISSTLVMGWMKFDNLARCQIQGNEAIASAAGFADAVLTVEDSSEVQIQRVITRRVSSAAAGVNIRVANCDRVMVQSSHWIQETANTGLLVLVGACDAIQLQGNIGFSSNAGAGVADAYHIEADGGLITNLQITGENLSTTGGTWDRAIFITATGGGTIGAVQVIPGVFTDCDTGVVFDDGGAGAATFTETGSLMVAGGVIDATTAAWDITVATVYLRVGSNACTFGPQMIAGNGDPEGAVTARIGSMFQRLDGGAATTLYIKESGVGNVGWVAK